MKQLYTLLGLLVLIVQSAHADVDLNSVRSRNNTAQDSMLVSNMSLAMNMLAGKATDKAWRNQLADLHTQVANINAYTLSNQMDMRSTSISNAQTVIQTIATEYGSMVFGNKIPTDAQNDAVLNNLSKSLRILQKLSNLPQFHAKLYADLSAQMTQLDQIIQQGAGQ